MKKISFLFYAIFAFASCISQKQEVNIGTAKILSHKTFSIERTYGVINDVILFEGNYYVYGIDPLSKKILVWINLESKNILYVPNNTWKEYNSWGSAAGLGIDSNLILNIYSDRLIEYDDLSIQLLNKNGKSIKTFPINNINLRSKYFNEKQPYNMMGGFMGSKAISLEKDLFFFTVENYTENFPYHNPNISIIGCLSLKNGKYSFIPILFPQSPKDHFFHENASDVMGVVDGYNRVLASFSHTPQVICYDLNRNTTKTVRMSSALLDTVMPIKNVPKNKDEIGKLSSDDKYQGYFSNILHDPYRNLYYRSYRIPPPDSSNTNIEKDLFAYAVFDSAFKPVGELILSGERYINFFTEEGTWVLNAAKSRERDSMYFEICDIQFRPGTVEELRDSARALFPKPVEKKGGLAAYMREVHGVSTPDMTVMFLEADNGCGPCSEYMCGYIQEHAKEWQGKPFALVIVAQEQLYLKDMLEKSGLKEQPLVYFDGNGEYLKYMRSQFNARIIIIRNGKDAGIMPLSTANYQKFPKYLEKSLKFQKK